jgi:hypothetical protein
MAIHNAHPPGFAHQFEDMEQQREAGSLGMWVFLLTELMFFGGLFATYIVYRALYLPSFEIGSHLLEVKFGALNTAVLIGSSLTMALAIRSAQVGKRGAQVGFLITTMILASRLHRTPGAGLRVRDSARMGSGWRACAHVFLFLFFYDRAARDTHDYRAMPPCRPYGDGAPRPL